MTLNLQVLLVVSSMSTKISLVSHSKVSMVTSTPASTLLTDTLFGLTDKFSVCADVDMVIHT